jgi:hypothetical protein
MPDLAPPRRQLRVSQRLFTADGRDRGLAALLTTASWLLQRLPGLVVEEQRDDLVRTLAGAQPLVIAVLPTVGVKISAAGRLLLDIPAEAAARQVRGPASGRGRTDPQQRIGTIFRRAREWSAFRPFWRAAPAQCPRLSSGEFRCRERVERYGPCPPSWRCWR